MDNKAVPPGAQANAASITAATVGLVLWMLESYLFHGAVPAEVAGFVILGVPWLSGRVAAELAYRRARRRLDTPPGV
jgi:hypothetical protein